VQRNDQIDVSAISSMQPQAIVISPGPCTPREAGCSLEVIRAFSGKIPMLGVCLGHQAMGAAFGGEVGRAETPMHGRTSFISHRSNGLLADLPSPLKVCRYHSLILQEATLPACFTVEARSENGEIMAIAHREHATFGVQFHPEAVLTEGGYRLLANFLRLAGCPVANTLPDANEERPSLVSDDLDWSHLPLTF
jgi:anthranilate synthase/aminodeoxychorismate synthase-like glutamine amidotransferase